MNVLSFDAVTPFASVGLMRDGQVVDDRMWESGRNHAAELPPAISEVMKLSGLGWDVLDAVVVGIGPGSYTGIRIAISLAKGIAAGSSCKTIGVDTLEHLAYGCRPWSGVIASAVPIGADRVAFALFESDTAGGWRRIQADCAVDKDACVNLPARTMVCGLGRSVLRGDSLVHAPESHDIPRASLLLKLMAETQREAGPLEPNYMRLSSAEERLAGRQ